MAVTAKLLVPDLPWAAAIALGAIVAPPDAVAATSVLKDFRMPKRIVTVLEGESLLNDASRLVLYRFAVAATMAGADLVRRGVARLPRWRRPAGRWSATLVGRAAMWIFARLEDTLLDILVSFLAGFAAYIAAEHLHVSGVLAAVACGLVLGQQQHAAFTARTRLEAGGGLELRRVRAHRPGVHPDRPAAARPARPPGAITILGSSRASGWPFRRR